VIEDAMRASGYTFEQIAQFVLEYTKAQGDPEGPDAVAEAEREDRVFSAVLPIRLLDRLKCLPEARG